MRVLLTGSAGQLGWEVRRAAAGGAHQLLALDRAALDITDGKAVARVLARGGADLVINAAAYTAVDKAEQEVEQAHLCNDTGAGILARACADRDIPLVHVSTDFVFDGARSEPWGETDRVAPLGQYGLSKAAGEERVRALLRQHLILRVSWVFGAHGHNFVNTIVKLAQARETLRVVNDQRGCPTWAGHIAGVLWQLVDRIAAAEPMAWGTYHYSDEPPTSWYGFAEAIVASARRRSSLALRELTPIGTDQYPLPARRPPNSVLDCALIGARFGITRQSWREGLEQTLDELLGGVGGAANGAGREVARR